MTADELANTVGKEAADKIINGKPNKEGWVDLRDDKLKIGGEGMKGFYDNIVPKTIEKLGKQFGVKVQKQKLPPKTNLTIEKDLDGTYAVMDDANRVHKSFRTEKEAQSWINERNPSNEIYYIDIPPAMRDKVLAEGFPLFSANVPVIDNDQTR